MSRQPISVLVTPTKSGGSICALLGSLLRCFDGVLPSQIVLVLPDDQDSMVLQQRLLELSAAGIELAIIRINEQKPQDAPRWRAMAWAECRYETAVFLEDNTIVEHGWWQAWRRWAGSDLATPVASGMVTPDLDRLGWCFLLRIWPFSACRRYGHHMAFEASGRQPLGRSARPDGDQ
jgi:hypothetical protein